jgi:histidine ammonia-lyase
VVHLSIKNSLSLAEAKTILLQGQQIQVCSLSLEQAEKSFRFLLEFSKDKVIYGINTGLGPMAQYKIDDDKLTDLQYNLIRSHSAGAGEPIPDMYVRATMLVRLRAIMQGKSAIHPSTIELLRDYINHGIYPCIPEHGGVGASGDLVQLSHLALGLIGEGDARYKGETRPVADILKELGLSPITVKLREGLSLINGTSVMTGIAAINVLKSKQLFSWCMIASSLLNEIVESFDDHFSETLNAAKLHRGQTEVASMLRNILASSKMISRREEHFFNSKATERIFKRKVQEYYSLRCLPQILGPVLDTINYTAQIVEDEINSVSDNPIVDMETGNVFHGGNFHGDYISLEMDKLRLAVVKMCMLSERQTAFLFNNKLNGILPPFVNLGTLGLNLGMQGAQFTATSTTAENQALSTSLYVHSITTNNDNQDIVSMGTNSALATKKVIDNSFQVLAIELISLLQAVDYLQAAHSLSSSTKDAYNKLRSIVPVFEDDKPLYKSIEAVRSYIWENEPSIIN